MNGDNAQTPRRIASLTELCQQKLTRHYESIRYLGAMPQFLVAGVLARCTPEQLENIELLNPHICEDNEPLWRLHCLKRHKDIGALANADPAMVSWREKYRELRLLDEMRAQEIMERVRGKMAEAEKQRNARKIRITSMAAASAKKPRAGAGARTGSASRGLSLVQKARMETRAHMSMLCLSPNARKKPADNAAATGTRSVTPARQTRPLSSRQQPSKPFHRRAPSSINTESSNSRPPCPPHRQSHSQSTALPKNEPSSAHWPRQQLSPVGEPAHSPTYVSSSSSYSPPYLSSSTPSCSPTHSSSAYSPPYVPDYYPSASSPGNSSKTSYSPKYDMFEAIFGMSSSCASTTLPPTVVIKEQTRTQKHRSAKRKREADKSDERFSPEQ
ncbi:hypothetical protein LPJ57_008906 [Coemansia sp. RSA 486]|nr:hypothetical protein LPJ57_008906 [Coemansia sp. RSA 486]KAJ2228905.1 hypothetical protein IWW45_006421 [Coemansia sp. RSA 485]